MLICGNHAEFGKKFSKLLFTFIYFYGFLNAALIIISGTMSRVWDNFNKLPVEGKVECKICKKKFVAHKSSTTSNFLLHLQKSHPDAIKLKKSDTDIAVVAGTSLETAVTGPLASCFSKNVTHLATKRLVEFICSSGVPLNCISDSNFQSFCNTLNSAYKVPSRSFLQGYIAKFANECRKEVLEKANRSQNVAISADCWSSPRNRVSLLAIILHFVDRSTGQLTWSLADCVPLRTRLAYLFLVIFNKI
jgi:hypothetical protein